MGLLGSNASEISGSAEWVCSFCTFTNSTPSLMCDMCANPRPTVNTLASQPQIYFEVTILSSGEQGTIGIGLVSANYSRESMPGWDEGGYGYHGDDGCIFGPPIESLQYGPPFSVGDTIGVGYYPLRGEIFFTKNGRNLGIAFTNVPIADYHIGVGMHSPGERVMLNVGQQSFIYRDVSTSHIQRPDIHWAADQDAFIITDLLKATWNSDECGLLLSNAPLLIGGKPAPIHSQELAYFEVTIQDDNPSHILIGLAAKATATNHMPGFDESSFMLHGANGRLFHNSFNRDSRPFTTPLRNGDTIGCGYDRTKGEIFYTRNGQLIGVAFAHVAEEEYLAEIGMNQTNEQILIRINFGETPFKYAILNNSKNVDNGIEESSSSPFPTLISPVDNALSDTAIEIVFADASVPDELIRVYLVHSIRSIVPRPDPAHIDATLESILSNQLWPIDYFTHVSQAFGPTEDEELIQLLSRRAEKSQVSKSNPSANDTMSPINIDPATFQMTPEERLTHTVLGAIMENYSSTPILLPTSEPSSSSSSDSNGELAAAPRLNPLSARFLFTMRIAFLQLLNESLTSTLTLVNFSKPARRSILSRHFRDSHVRSIFFEHIKRMIIRQALNQTAATSEPTKAPFMLRLDLFKAQKLVHQGRCDNTGTKSIFGQAFQALHLHRHDEENKYGDHDRDPTRLLVKYRQKPWKTVFKGMYADDYGGLYRDMLEKLCQELQSSVLPLFIPCPNAREQIGLNRNHFVPNPSATSPLQLSMFEFLGKLMGVAMRTGELLTLDLPSIVWKSLLEDSILEEDVMAIDRLSFKLLNELRKLESHINTGSSGISPDEFKEYMDSTFVVIGSDMKAHELVPGGEHIPVTWSNRDEFVSALIWYRKHEFRLQCAAIRQGLAQVVPISLLSVCTWTQLRDMICGTAKIDIQLLKR